MFFIGGMFLLVFFFFFSDAASTEIYTLSLHDALPICARRGCESLRDSCRSTAPSATARGNPRCARRRGARGRSEEHTSELQSRRDLVCRLLLEKKNKQA